MCARALMVAVAGLLLAGTLVAHADGLRRDVLEGLRLTLPVATAPPPLALKRLDNGRTLTLSELRGRPVLLYFWATW
jgi:cytochrome oxidase Cu insertion factor (SCO1/SenC/PrrC family)